MNSKWLNSAVKAAASGIVCAGLALSQVPEPKGAGLEPGTFAAHWITGGPDCATVPKWQVHAYNPDLYILRESGCLNYPESGSSAGPRPGSAFTANGLQLLRRPPFG